MDYERFQWRETTPGVWRRDVDECELAYTALAKLYEASGRGFFHITGHLSLIIDVISPEEVDEALRKAWIALRHHHPAIASRTKWDATSGRYVKEYPSIVDGWLEQTLISVEKGQNGLEFANSDPPAPKLPTLFIVAPPTSEGASIRRDLVFRSPHDIIDGIGTLYLLNNYARLASEALAQGDAFKIPSLEAPEVVPNLSPPFRVAAALPPTPSEEVQKRLASPASGNRVSAVAADPPKPIGLPYKKGALLPGKHQRVEITLSKDDSARIIAASKRVGATVTHIFHAAIAIALRDLQEGISAGKVQYINYILRNERSNCVPPFNDGTLHPAGIYHCASSQKLLVDMTIPGELSEIEAKEEQREAFLSAMQTIKDFYHGVRDDKEHFALTPYIWAAATPELPTPTGDGEESLNLPVPPPKDLAAVSISSMGRIDTIMPPAHGPIELHNPWVTGEELRSGLGAFLGTFRGELSISAAYNDAWHGREGAESFLRRCLDVVKNGLSL